MTLKFPLPLGKRPATIDIFDVLHPRVHALVPIVP